MTKDNNYAHFKTIKSWDEYFDNLNNYNGNDTDIDKSIKEEIYHRYRVKCEVFGRANFKCQNLKCKTHDSPLTYHHIKFDKNNGKWSARNGLCLCDKCQHIYHNAKGAIKLAKDESVPAHVRGHTLQLDTPDNIRWKEIRREALRIQRKCKHIRNVRISWELLTLLMVWLEQPYNDIADYLKDIEAFGD